MEYLKVIFISIIQGITEFLPISSSGHIVLLKNLMQLEIDATFDVVIHMGTLLAVILIYFNDIKELIFGIFKKNSGSTLFGDNLIRKDYYKIFMLFIIATLPGGIIGLVLEKYLDFEPSNTPKWLFLLLTISFIFTTLLLLSTNLINYSKKFNKIKKFNIVQLSYLRSLFIGFFQALAVLPGVSRSGSTITASIYANLNKKDAARFSFILSIPLIIAAFLLKLFKLIQNEKIADINLIILLIIGFLVSFVTGYFALKILLKMLQNGKFWLFSIYLIIPIILSITLWIK